VPPEYAYISVTAVLSEYTSNCELISREIRSNSLTRLFDKRIFSKMKLVARSTALTSQEQRNCWLSRVHLTERGKVRSGAFTVTKFYKIFSGYQRRRLVEWRKEPTFRGPSPSSSSGYLSTSRRFYYSGKLRLSFKDPFKYEWCQCS
jgi:hypothetical protein